MVQEKLKNKRNTIPDTGKAVRKYQISSPRARRHAPGYFEIKKYVE